MGKILHESVDEFERMTDAGKAEFWERTDTTDHKLEAFAARMDALAEERENG